MKTVQTQVIELLDSLHYEYLTNLRLQLYRAIEETRDEARYQDEEARPAIVAEIKRIGQALEDARSVGLRPGSPIYDELVVHVRRANHERAHNRFIVKQLAADQAVQKGALAEINREISNFENSAALAAYEDTDHAYDYAVEEAGPLHELRGF